MISTQSSISQKSSKQFAHFSIEKVVIWCYCTKQDTEVSGITVHVLYRASTLEIFIQLISSRNRVVQVTRIHNLTIMLCHGTGNKHTVSDIFRVRFNSQLQVYLLPRGHSGSSPLGSR